FGVPGSSGMAILLGAFVMLGITPGPELALEGMDVVLTLIWALMIANVLAVALFFALAPAFGYLSYVRGSLLIPFVFTLTYLGSYLSQRAWENLVLLTALGGLGYLMKKYDWPRPPFVIGLILGPIMEDSFHKAWALWGPAFLLRPGALSMLALIAVSLGVYIRQTRRSSTEFPHAA
ncbi:MAG: tripartite tricarboxylate transporter permease, partial [Gammaproteobacteria bacterium]|nr:tripartite tricarboxylate transporter permease [Gammaproteobacteria bacterium]